MAETIPGGAYQNPDGSWHDAQGKALSSSQIEKAKQLLAEKAKEQAQAEANLESQLPAAPVSVVTVPAPPEPPEEEVAPAPTTRRPRRGG